MKEDVTFLRAKISELNDENLKLKSEIEVIGNIHENPELLEDK